MKKILVRGPVLSRSGYGEQTRFALRSLKSCSEQFDVYLDITPWGSTGWIWEDNDERHWFDSLVKKTGEYTQTGGQYDLSLQVVVPNEFQQLAPVNVGYTAGIEASRVHPTWLQASQGMNKIITVSNSGRQIYQSTTYQTKPQEDSPETSTLKCGCEMDTVGFPIPSYKPESITDLDFSTSFNFLIVASWIPRKNLENTLRWFLEEFYDNENIGLVVKTQLATNSTPDRYETSARLRKLVAEFGIENRKCKIHFLHGDFTDEQMLGLYAHPKIKGLINLTHGEGFGLPLLEAATVALPIIAPDWGGYLDFLYVPMKKKNGKFKLRPRFSRVKYTMQLVPDEVINSMQNIFAPESKWCEPDSGDYKMKLRDMYKNYEKYAKMARELQQHLQIEWTEEKKNREFVDSILSLFNVTDDEIENWLGTIELL